MWKGRRLIHQWMKLEDGEEGREGGGKEEGERKREGEGKMERGENGRRGRPEQRRGKGQLRRVGMLNLRIFPLSK